MAADGHRDMQTLQRTFTAPASRSSRRIDSGRLGVAVLLVGIVGTVGWIGLLALWLIRFSLLALGLS
jgi:hypothetical protein